MDELDVRIVRAMGVRPFGHPRPSPNVLKPGHVAQRVGTTPVTVKAHLARMASEGVIAGYQVVPNLRQLGYDAAAYFSRVADEGLKDAMFGELEHAVTLLEVHDFVGDGVCVDLAFRSVGDRDTQIQALGKVTGDAHPQPFYRRDYPPVKRPLSHLDWRIIRALRWRATRPLREVAADVGVSPRTVKRHYDRMVRGGSIFPVPLLDPARASGLLLVDLLLYLDPGAGAEAMSTARRRFDGRHLFTYTPATPALGNFNLVVVARTSAEVAALRDEAAAIPGVARAEAWLFRAFMDRSRWLDGAIEARVRETAS